MENLVVFDVCTRCGEPTHSYHECLDYKTMPCYFHTHGIDGCRFDDMPVYCFFAHTSIEPIRTPLATRCVKIKKNPNKSYFIDLGCGNTEKSYHACCKSMRDNFEISRQIKVRRIYPWVVGGGQVGGKVEKEKEKEKEIGDSENTLEHSNENTKEHSDENTQSMITTDGIKTIPLLSYKDMLLKNQK
jgi:hypothetical protein